MRNSVYRKSAIEGSRIQSRFHSLEEKVTRNEYEKWQYIDKNELNIDQSFEWEKSNKNSAKPK